MRESDLSAKIRKRIEMEYPGAMTRKRHVSMGVVGDPDVYGCLPGGVHFEIEVKRPGNKPSALQQQRMNEWQGSGAIVGVAYNVEEALGILRRGRHGRFDGERQ